MPGTHFIGPHPLIGVTLAASFAFCDPHRPLYRGSDSCLMPRDSTLIQDNAQAVLGRRSREDPDHDR